MENLKPCPFCGGKSKIDFRFHKGQRLVIAKCTRCGASAKPVSENYIGYDEAIDDATNAWNTRYEKV